MALVAAVSLRLLVRPARVPALLAAARGRGRGDGLRRGVLVRHPHAALDVPHPRARPRLLRAAPLESGRRPRGAGEPAGDARVGRPPLADPVPAGAGVLDRAGAGGAARAPERVAGARRGGGVRARPAAARRRAAGGGVRGALSREPVAPRHQHPRLPRRGAGDPASARRALPRRGRALDPVRRRDPARARLPRGRGPAGDRHRRVAGAPPPALARGRGDRRGRRRRARRRRGAG